MNARLETLTASFQEHFGCRQSQFFTSSGRMEIVGNHTDHQGGCVLVAAINLLMVAAVSKRNDKKIVVFSEGYPPFEVDLSDLAIHETEINKSCAILRGVSARFRELGYRIGGMSIVMSSDIKPGAGVSSSASFELLIGNIMNHLYNDGNIPKQTLAYIAQYAENRYFGKPSGLLDQMGIALGGINYIEFADKKYPLVEPVPYDFSDLRFLIINTGGSHTDLTVHYSSIKDDMHRIAAHFGADRLIEVTTEQFHVAIATLVKEYGATATNRALHFFEENERVRLVKYALMKGDRQQFLRWVNHSGRSSENLLKNITFDGDVDKKMLNGIRFCQEHVHDGAYRVHGGGFAGTILVIIPQQSLTEFLSSAERYFGKGNVLQVDIVQEGIAQIHS